MKFPDCLTSIMGGVRVRRSSWPKGVTLQVSCSATDGLGNNVTTFQFTQEDADATDWAIYVPGLQRESD